MSYSFCIFRYIIHAIFRKSAFASLEKAHLRLTKLFLVRGKQTSRLHLQTWLGKDVYLGAIWRGKTATKNFPHARKEHVTCELPKVHLIMTKLSSRVFPRQQRRKKEIGKSRFRHRKLQRTASQKVGRGGKGRLR